MLKRWKTEVVIDEALERQYQEAALQVMKKHGVQVNDLHALMKPRRSEFQADDNVHFSPAGSALMAQQVADCILMNLDGKRSHREIGCGKLAASQDAIFPPCPPKTRNLSHSILAALGKGGITALFDENEEEEANRAGRAHPSSASVDISALPDNR